MLMFFSTKLSLKMETFWKDFAAPSETGFLKMFL